MIKLITATLLTATTFQVFNAVNDFHTTFPQPIEMRQKEDVRLTETREALKLLKAPPDKLEQLTKACYSAGFATNIDPVLIASIIPKESEFDIKAKSKSGYKGLMQTPKALMKWEYAEADVMRGACVLRNHIIDSKGNLDRAMVYYKGFGGKESKHYAAEQMKFYRNIKQQIKEQMKGIV